MKVFLLSGKAGSGKSEVANILKEELGNAVVTNLSKYIKLLALELTNWDGSESNKPREFLQTMGDNLRSIDPDFLTKRLLEDIKIYDSVGINYVIISDVRLLSEINYFKNIDNLDVCLIRVNSEKSKRNLTSSEKNHITEIELDNYELFDYVIQNNFDNNLKNEVNKILIGEK